MDVRPQPRGTIKIDGCLDIKSASLVYGDIKSAWPAEDTIILDVDGLEDCDLTAVQLLESIRRSAVDSGKSAALSAPASGALREVLARGGFDRAMTEDQSQFWFPTSGAN